jgi:hypothetical protein
MSERILNVTYFIVLGIGLCYLKPEINSNNLLDNLLII